MKKQTALNKEVSDLFGEVMSAKPLSRQIIWSFINGKPYAEIYNPKTGKYEELKDV